VPAAESVWRPHPASLYGRLLIGVGVTFVIGYVAGFLARQGIVVGWVVLALVWLVTMVVVLLKVVRWSSTAVVVTGRGLGFVKGGLKPVVREIPMSEIVALLCKQSRTGRYLDYMDLKIVCRNGEQSAVFEKAHGLAVEQIHRAVLVGVH
jgi:hypothetical protein